MAASPDADRPLLETGEPPAFTVMNASGSSPLVLVCDHASNRIPRRLQTLGLDAETLDTHIAWDPGAALVAKSLSAKLDAALVLSNYSRLVIDCNRPLISPESIPERSAGIDIPGNRSLSAGDRAVRAQACFMPYQQAISQLLQQRAGPSLLLSIHSFTPVLDGVQRPWPIGVACYRDQRLARALYAGLRQCSEELVGFNQPYEIELEFDYTIPVQGESRGLPCAMVEIRQDGIRGPSEVECWVERLASAWRLAELSLRR